MFRAKSRKILYLMIGIIILIISYLVILYFNNYKNTDTEENSSNNISSEEFKLFKEPKFGFEYIVPDELEYENYDQYYFKITSQDNWYAMVTLDPMSVNNHKTVDEIYDEYMKELNETEEKVFKEKYYDIDIVVYQKLQENKIDYYFVTPWDYCYRIVVFYEGDEFQFDYLKEVMYSLLTPDYDEVE